MKLLELGRGRSVPVTQYASAGVSSVLAARGAGRAHVYQLHFGPGGRIGRHPAGPGQLFLVVEGSGWVEGADGLRHEIRAGQAAWFAPGEAHAKGSETGMTAVMVQVEGLEPEAPVRAAQRSAR